MTMTPRIRKPVRVGPGGATIRKRANSPLPGGASGVVRGNVQRERALQKQCVAYLRILKTQKRLNFAPIPNGTFVAGRTREDREIRVRNMKVDGMLEPGAPDLVIALPAARILWPEAKRPDGKGRLSQDQDEFITLLVRLGHECFVFETFDEFKARVDDALARAEAAAAAMATP